jgi:TetR/AcrR family transcriptional regulator, transcriptional repressor of bet genes
MTEAPQIDSPDRRSSDRRPYARVAEEQRRDDLITAVLDLVAMGGTDAATVRAIAERAGVTLGMIRHHFGDKNSLMRAAYARMSEAMVAPCVAAADAAGDDPLRKLQAFLSAALRPPVLDPQSVGVWAAYMHRVRTDPDLRAAHEAGYLNFRDRLEALIAGLPATATATNHRATTLPPRHAAIALNALLDGLWIEGSLLPHGFAEGELELIALSAASRLLGTDLRHKGTAP